MGVKNQETIQGKNTHKNQDLFYNLGALTCTFEEYYRFRKNKAIIKHIPMFISWMQESNNTSQITQDLIQFFEKKYQILFPPNKIRSFYGKGPDGTKLIDQNILIQKDPTQFKELKKCFINANYWRKLINDPNTSYEMPLYPVVSFFNGYDKDIAMIQNSLWESLEKNLWGKSLLVLGVYFRLVMTGEIILLGNKGLFGNFLSRIKQLNSHSIFFLFESIISTEMNLIQRMGSFVGNQQSSIIEFISLIQKYRKTSAFFIKQLIDSSDFKNPPSNSIIQFYLMAGILAYENIQNLAIDSYIHGHNFTPRGALMYTFGRVVFNAAQLEIDTFKSRSYLRLIALYRSPEYRDWLILFNNCLRISIRTLGKKLLENRKNQKTIESVDNILLPEYYIKKNFGVQANMINVLIKEFLQILENHAVAPRSYEASTAFMMGFNYEQIFSKKTSK